MGKLGGKKAVEVEKKKMVGAGELGKRDPGAKIFGEMGIGVEFYI